METFVIDSFDLLKHEFEILFKKYEIAGSARVNFEELQEIFNQLKTVKYKLAATFNQQDVS